MKILSRNFLPFSESPFLLKALRTKSEEDIRSLKGHHLFENNQILFIHNPKVAGNSILKLLKKDNLKVSTSHKTPTFLVNKNTWENTISIVGVRHPVDRLVSSYYYHTNPKYQGYFLHNYPGLKDMSLEQYFECFKSVPYVIMPQYYYTQHFLSNMKVDYIVRFENLEHDLKEIASNLGLHFENIPHLNASKRLKNKLFQNTSFKERVVKYYHKDFDILDYTPDFKKYE